MILERALFTVRPGDAEEFKAVFADARRYVETSRGCHRLELRQGIESPDTFLLVVWWETLEDHTKGFRESDAFTQWRALIGRLFAAPPMVEHYAEAI
jgi:heme-degrading monooxygenase HmoA